METLDLHRVFDSLEVRDWRVHNADVGVSECLSSGMEQWYSRCRRSVSSRGKAGGCNSRVRAVDTAHVGVAGATDMEHK
jgi:hypothetical protein